MPRPQVKGFARPDQVREMPGFRVESADLGDVSVGYCTFQPGWRWSRDMAPLLGVETCPMRHLGYCVSGTMRVAMDDGRELDIGPHTVFDIPPGHDKWVVGDEAWVAVEWGGTERASRAAEDEGGNRILATLLFTDIVDSTAAAVAAGDAVWRETLAAHNNRMRDVLNHHRGREVATTGDGFLALLDSPARAVRCATAMVRAADGLGLPIRVGLHTGEVERVGDDIRGVAVHVAARIMSLAGPGEVTLSATTADLLVGSGVHLEQAGTHHLKGLPGEWRILRVAW